MHVNQLSHIKEVTKKGLLLRFLILLTFVRFRDVCSKPRKRRANFKAYEPARPSFPRSTVSAYVTDAVASRVPSHIKSGEERNASNNLATT